MIRQLATLTIICLFLAAKTEAVEVRDRLPPPPEGKVWKLVWHDEFDGEKLDETKWDVPENRRRDGWWSRKAITLDGKGNLVISALKDGGKYLDGCVRTRGKFEHAHGYYVARIRLQEQPGHWSAFWMWGPGVGSVEDEGRDGTEIDNSTGVTPSLQLPMWGALGNAGKNHLWC